MPDEFRGTPLDWCSQCKTYHYRGTGCHCRREIADLKTQLQLAHDRANQLQQTVTDRATEIERLHARVTELAERLESR